MDCEGAGVLRRGASHPDRRGCEAGPGVYASGSERTRKEVHAASLDGAFVLTSDSRHGASVEDMTIEVNKAREKLQKAENDLKQMTSLNKVCLLMKNFPTLWFDGCVFRLSRRL